MKLLPSARRGITKPLREKYAVHFKEHYNLSRIESMVILPLQFLQGQLHSPSLQRPDGDLGDSERAQEGRDGSGKAQL